MVNNWYYPSCKDRVISITCTEQLPADAFLLGFSSFAFLFSSVIILATGTIFAMWLGEKITDKGIGNGISLLIMVGILGAFATGIYSRVLFPCNRKQRRTDADRVRGNYLVINHYCLYSFSHGGSVKFRYSMRVVQHQEILNRT